jgi:hypothetical protein
MVAEVSLEGGRPRVHRVHVRRRLRPHVQPRHGPGAARGRRRASRLTAALYWAITLKDGRVEQSNFHDYRMLRIHEMPAVEVHIVPSEEPSSGVGEPGRAARRAARSATRSSR